MVFLSLFLDVTRMSMSTVSHTVFPEFFPSKILSFDLIGFPIYLSFSSSFSCNYTLCGGCSRVYEMNLNFLENQQFHIWKKKESKRNHNSIFSFENILENFKISSSMFVQLLMPYLFLLNSYWLKLYFSFYIFFY